MKGEQNQVSSLQLSGHCLGDISLGRDSVFGAWCWEPGLGQAPGGRAWRAEDSYKGPGVADPSERSV